MRFCFSVWFLLFSTCLMAEPVVSESTSFGCTTEIQEAKNWVEQPAVASGVELPNACTDLSGEWEGGCYWAAVKPGLHGPGGIPMYTAETVLPENVWTPYPLTGEPDLVPTHTATIRQDGCKQVLFDSSHKDSPLHKLNINFEADPSASAFIRFRKACDDGRGNSWNRLYEMPLAEKFSPRWNAAANEIHSISRVTGADANYGATYRNIMRTRFYLKGDQLRVDSAWWMSQERYHPPGYRDEPAFGGKICVYRRK